MIMTNKLLPVALVAALIGGSVGAFVMHSRNQSTTADTTTTPAYSTSADTQFARYQPNASVNDPSVPAQFDTTQEQTAYKSGFADGFRGKKGAGIGALAGAGGSALYTYKLRHRNRRY